MVTQQLIDQVLALPLAERVDLVGVLWQSIGAGLEDTEEQNVIELARRRGAEMANGTVVGRSHEEVMQAARQAIQCD